MVRGKFSVKYLDRRALNTHLGCKNIQVMERGRGKWRMALKNLGERIRR